MQVKKAGTSPIAKITIVSDENSSSSIGKYLKAYMVCHRICHIDRYFSRLSFAHIP